jgi:hypothetical protein
MAIFGIKGNKRLGGEPQESDLPIGYLQDGELHFSNNCIEAIKVKFAVLNSNRINSLGEIIEQKKKIEFEKKLPFTPNLMATKMINKVLLKNNFNIALRARSVSKDYKLLTEQKYQWRDQ